MTGSEATRFEILEAREAIRDLLARYCYLIARGDVDRVIELFTSDCRVEILGQEYAGTEGLERLYAASLVHAPKPFIHNHLIEEVAGDVAHGRCVLDIWQKRDGVEERGGGCYVDHYRRESGQWKFSQRTFQPY